ncbi:MAG TPA: CdaR family protein [Blastocatellia bacterium]|nr:CdaR family protein [Blastocatellia bacterium]
MTGKPFGTLKEFARDYLLENTALKILALLITAVLWLSVASQPVTTINNVPVVLNLRDAPDLVVSKSETMSARVVLRGPREVLDGLGPNDLTVVADLAGAEPGVRVIPLQVDRSRLPSSVQARSVEPKTVSVTIERVVKRDVGIEPRFQGDVPAGFEVKWEVIPSRIKIRGLANQLGGINQVSTESINIRGKIGQFTEQVAVDIGIPNVGVAEDEPDRVQVKYSVQELPTEHTIPGVPVVLAGAGPSTRVSPRVVSVVVAGPRSLVETLNPGDITVSVQFHEEITRPIEVAPSVSLAKDGDRLTIRSVTPATVRVLPK